MILEAFALVASMFAGPVAPVTHALMNTEDLLASWFETPVVWAGHQVVTGEKKVPVLGTLSTRVDTYTLATVRRSGDQLLVEQTACEVEFKKVAGTQIDMKISALPRTRTRFKLDGEGGKVLGGSVVKWGREDLDRDGKPGMSVQVDAPMCGGTLHVANNSRTRARGTLYGATGMRGTVDVVTDQEILGADGGCLERMAKDSSERNQGHFAFVQVDAASTCKALLAEGWPVRAG